MSVIALNAFVSKRLPLFSNMQVAAEQGLQTLLLEQLVQLLAPASAAGGHSGSLLPSGLGEGFFGSPGLAPTPLDELDLIALVHASRQTGELACIHWQ